MEVDPCWGAGERLSTLVKAEVVVNSGSRIGGTSAEKQANTKAPMVYSKSVKIKDLLMPQ